MKPRFPYPELHKPGMLVTLAFGKWRQEDWKFKVILNDTAGGGRERGKEGGKKGGREEMKGKEGKTKM